MIFNNFETIGKTDLMVLNNIPKYEYNSQTYISKRKSRITELAARIH